MNNNTSIVVCNPTRNHDTGLTKFGQGLFAYPCSLVSCLIVILTGCSGHCSDLPSLCALSREPADTDPPPRYRAPASCGWSLLCRTRPWCLSLLMARSLSALHHPLPPSLCCSRLTPLWDQETQFRLRDKFFTTYAVVQWEKSALLLKIILQGIFCYLSKAIDSINRKILTDNMKTFRTNYWGHNWGIADNKVIVWGYY